MQISNCSPLSTDAELKRNKLNAKRAPSQAALKVLSVSLASLPEFPGDAFNFNDCCLCTIPGGSFVQSVVLHNGATAWVPSMGANLHDRLRQFTLDRKTLKYYSCC